MPAQHGTVLVVEDEDPLRQAIVKMLIKTGFDVFEAVDGPSAIARLRADGDKVDVILLDLTIPGASHYEVVAEAAKAKPSMGVILTSAYSYCRRNEPITDSQLYSQAISIRGSLEYDSECSIRKRCNYDEVNQFWFSKTGLASATASGQSRFEAGYGRLQHGLRAWRMGCGTQGCGPEKTAASWSVRFDSGRLPLQEDALLRPNHPPNRLCGAGATSATSRASLFVVNGTVSI
jgi:CheY-like chemotaxis protein